MLRVFLIKNPGVALGHPFFMPIPPNPMKWGEGVCCIELRKTAGLYCYCSKSLKDVKC
jgi:hypothetical protein